MTYAGVVCGAGGSDRVCKVHLPKADAKDKVKRFQGLGVYVNKVSAAAARMLDLAASAHAPLGPRLASASASAPLVLGHLRTQMRVGGLAGA